MNNIKMSSINIDALIEYFTWTVMFYIFPNFFNAVIVTLIVNSDAARLTFKRLIALVHKRIRDTLLNFELNTFPTFVPQE